MNTIVRFFEKVIKIITYIPILWKDEDWSWEYIINILNFKLKRVARCLRSSFVEEEYKQADVIDHIVELLNRVTNENFYCCQEFRNHERKWGKFKYNFFSEKTGEKWTMEDEKRWEILENNGKCEKERIHSELLLKGYYTKARNANEEKQAWNEYFNILKKQERLLQRDLDEAFKLISKNIRRWWN